MIFLLLVSLQLFASSEIIKSKDDIVFHTPDTFKFSDVGKIPEFRGVIDRVYFTFYDLKMIDLYQFKTEAIKVNNTICMDYVEKIFTIAKSNIYELKTLKIVDSNKGKICEVVLSDKVIPKKKEDSFQRLVTIGFINTKANVLVYHLKGVSDDKITEARQFWNSLR